MMKESSTTVPVCLPSHPPTYNHNNSYTPTYIHNDCDWYVVCFPLITGYAPIRLHGNSHVTLDLPYSFFYDLKVIKQSGGNNGGGPSIPGGKRRKRRQENVQEILQKVELTFRPVEVGASVLLHSETERYVHQLMVSRVCKLDECSFKRDLMMQCKNWIAATLV